MPWTSSGLVSLRTRMTLLAALVGVGSIVGGEVDPADGGARRGRQTLGDDLALAGELRVQHLVEVVGGDAHDRFVLADLPAALPLPVPFVMSTAIFSAAAPVRLPTRVCSIHSLPCSMVNSVSHMSW